MSYRVGVHGYMELGGDGMMRLHITMPVAAKRVLGAQMRACDSALREEGASMSLGSEGIMVAYVARPEYRYESEERSILSRKASVRQRFTLHWKVMGGANSRTFHTSDNCDHLQEWSEKMIVETIDE